ncbi:MAG: TetR family transcriptional regulator [Steroidobacteraceae bacterium]|jgi:AcrR family transcriptional regulator|nr:TetR family transcriptional regulator [Steroidobacteraceae bacterium]
MHKRRVGGDAGSRGARDAARPGPVPRRSKVDGRVRGRPRKGSRGDARAALLEAARGLFSRYGYREVSARQIARAAGVNPSLLAYYFKGKYGLYGEVLARALEPVFAAAGALVAPVAGEPAEEAVERLVGAYMRVLAANPWIPGLILREVLAGSGPWRDAFVRDFPSRLAPPTLEAIADGIRAGRLRPGLDPRLVLVSCIALAVMPFLGAPVFSRLFGDGMVREPDALIEHTLDFIRHALRAPRP